MYSSCEGTLILFASCVRTLSLRLAPPKSHFLALNRNKERRDIAAVQRQDQSQALEIIMTFSVPSQASGLNFFMAELLAVV